MLINLLPFSVIQNIIDCYTCAFPILILQKISSTQKFVDAVVATDAEYQTSIILLFL